MKQQPQELKTPKPQKDRPDLLDLENRTSSHTAPTYLSQGNEPGQIGDELGVHSVGLTNQTLRAKHQSRKLGDVASELTKGFTYPVLVNTPAESHFLSDFSASRGSQQNLGEVCFDAHDSPASRR
jgi:hypothetical protein